MDQTFLVDLWLSIKDAARRLIRPALFLLILLLVYGHGREDLTAEDSFLIVVLSLFAFVAILVDILDKDDPQKAKLVVGAMIVGSALALAIPIADHMKVGREVDATADAEKGLAKVGQIEAVASSLQDGRFLRVNADGSIEVIDSAEMEREHTIKLLNARVAGYREFVYATGRHVDREGVKQIASTANINELLGVGTDPDLSLEESDGTTLEHPVGIDGTPHVESVPAAVEHLVENALKAGTEVATPVP